MHPSRRYAKYEARKLLEKIFSPDPYDYLTIVKVLENLRKIKSSPAKRKEEIEVKSGRELENERESPNASRSQKSEDAEEEDEEEEEEEEESRSTSEEPAAGGVTREEIVFISPSPEYEPETNNNECAFYKQGLAKQALAGVF